MHCGEIGVGEREHCERLRDDKNYLYVIKLRFTALTKEDKPGQI